MIIPYSKKSDKREIGLGFLYILIGIGYALIEAEEIIFYLFILTGILYFATVVYKKKHPYLQVNNGILKKSDLIPKKIELSKIKRIKEFAGEYTLFSAEKKLKIHRYLISKDSRQEFDSFIESLNLQIENTTRKVSSFKQH